MASKKVLVVGAAAFAAWLFIRPVRRVVAVVVYEVVTTMAAPLGPLFSDIHSLLGDPRGFSLADPLVDLTIYFFACLWAASWIAQRVHERTEPGPGRLVGLLPIIVLAALPALAVSYKNDVANSFPIPGTPEANWQMMEVMFSWLSLFFGGFGMFRVYCDVMIALRGIGPIPNHAADLETVRNQTTLGDARAASAAEINAALQGGGVTAAPRFED